MAIRLAVLASITPFVLAPIAVIASSVNIAAHSSVSADGVDRTTPPQDPPAPSTSTDPTDPPDLSGLSTCC